MNHSTSTTTEGPTLLNCRRFHVVELTTTTASGERRQRHVVRHPGSVVILPLVNENQVCLIRNYRPSVNKTLIELPAGTLEPNEPPRETALRELIEETGYRCQELEELHQFYAAPGILDERMHLFVARGLTVGETAREPGEEIENLVLTWDEALQLIAAGQIEDAKTILGLLLYRHRCR
ncbi:MAG: NUDIX hydrolase [Planctomycetota bacterium]